MKYYILGLEFNDQGMAERYKVVGIQDRKYHPRLSKVERCITEDDYKRRYGLSFYLDAVDRYLIPIKLGEFISKLN